MKETLLQFGVGIGGVIFVFVFGSVYRLGTGFDPPFGEVAIATIGTIAGARTLMTGYSELQVRKATIQYGAGADQTPPRSGGQP